ncbi:MAG: hypothetical protein ACI3V0_12300 [Faecousia sp.]
MQLMTNPKAEICAFHDGTWVRIAGELVEDDRVEARKSRLDAYPSLRKMYDENDGNTQVFHLFLHRCAGDHRILKNSLHVFHRANENECKHVPP